jgi:hypothetical protein
VGPILVKPGLEGALHSVKSAVTLLVQKTLMIPGRYPPGLTVLRKVNKRPYLV